MTADPLVLVAEVERATVRLLKTARVLDDAALREPSLLPGWSRAHVLSHLARNADSYLNLLSWARTGVVTPQYPSLERRAADVEAGAGRDAGTILDDLRESATRLADAVHAMPSEAWLATVRFGGGREVLAASLPWSRLCEVQIHHVDLNLGYGPGDWPEVFTARLLHDLETNSRQLPAMRLRATDTGRELRVGPAAGDPVTVSGPGGTLAGWLIGRADGAGLTVSPDGPLPSVPPWKR